MTLPTWYRCRRVVVGLALIAGLAGTAGLHRASARAAALQGDGPPFAPAQSLSTLKGEPGLRIDLFAHEPDTMSPVAMDVDEDGRVFVVEMPGYPLDTSPSGRIRLLEDGDGDGRADRRTVFADDLVLPTGVMRWKQGILVTAAPDLLYFEDTDDDGRADVRRVLLTGFAQHQSTTSRQHPGLRSGQLDHARARRSGRSHHLQDALRRCRRPAPVPGGPGDRARSRRRATASASASARIASRRDPGPASSVTPSTRGATTSRSTTRTTAGTRSWRLVISNGILI